jgi:anti-anti-sigma factor
MPDLFDVTMDAAAHKVSPEYVRIERDDSMPAGKGRATFVVTGELDIANVDRLVGAVVPDAVMGAHVILDLSGVDFMDCSVIHALIEILSAVGPDGRVIVRRPSRQVRRVLELVNAHRFQGLVIADQ